MNECMWMIADPSMPLTDLTLELMQMGVPGSEALPWQDKMLHAALSTVGQLLKLTISQFEEASGSTLSPFSARTLGVCLGSVGSPHVFAPDPPKPSAPSFVHPLIPVLPDDIRDQLETQGMPLPPASESMAKIEPIKGGTLLAVAEMLEERRTYMYPDSYFPPITFDKYHHSIPRGDDKALRKLIVQEISEVCGDLYPNMNERGVILPAIEQFVGVPATGGHWDNWRIDIAGITKKHKGAAVSDLEKARRAPAAYGVSGRRVPDRMRPTRPRRSMAAPPSAYLAGGFSAVLHSSSADAGTNVTGTAHRPQGEGTLPRTNIALGTRLSQPSSQGSPPQDSPPEDHYGADQLADLDNDEQMAHSVTSMSAELKEKKGKEDAAKTAKAAAAKAIRQAKKDAKDATKAAQSTARPAAKKPAAKKPAAKKSNAPNASQTYKRSGHQSESDEESDEELESDEVRPRPIPTPPRSHSCTACTASR